MGWTGYLALEAPEISRLKQEEAYMIIADRPGR
jgi:hypothetical protein